MEFKPELLKDAIDVGLELAGAPRGLKPGKNQKSYELPELPESWQPTLDTLRPPKPRDEPFWEWRKRPPEPVVFRPHDKIQSGQVHLHLEHPFVKRVFDRFRAQGYSAHDLSRVTVVKNSNDALVRVIAFGRLSLFGPGATRLHDQLVSVAAQWLQSKGDNHLKPFADEADKKAIATLEELLTESPTLDGISESVQQKLKASAPDDFATLWPHISDEADSLAYDATQKLKDRGRIEAEGLRGILRNQEAAIRHEINRREQTEFEFSEGQRAEREQYEQDAKYMDKRLRRIETELAEEPKQIEALYQVSVRRLEPVGLIYLWPETRG